jgi:branched-chain amino acid transport system substrate-binding protein
MALNRRDILKAGAAAPLGGLPWRSAKAQAANTIKLGVPVDMSGMYRDVTGSVSVAAARQAVQSAAKRTRCISTAPPPHQI